MFFFSCDMSQKIEVSTFNSVLKDGHYELNFFDNVGVVNTASGYVIFVLSENGEILSELFIEGSGLKTPMRADNIVLLFFRQKIVGFSISSNRVAWEKPVDYCFSSNTIIKEGIAKIKIISGDKTILENIDVKTGEVVSISAEGPFMQFKDYMMSLVSDSFSILLTYPPNRVLSVFPNVDNPSENWRYIFEDKTEITNVKPILANGYLYIGDGKNIIVIDIKEGIIKEKYKMENFILDILENDLYIICVQFNNLTFIKKEDNVIEFSKKAFNVRNPGIVGTKLIYFSDYHKMIICDFDSTQKDKKVNLKNQESASNACGFLNNYFFISINGALVKLKD